MNTMKHYLCLATQEVFAYAADGSQDAYIKKDLVPLTNSELLAILNPPPTQAQLREVAKLERAEAVSKIVVTTTSGNTFDGDEMSQGRMARAILALKGDAKVVWVLADNTPVEVTSTELTEALALAGAAQAAVWVLPKMAGQ